MDSRIARPLLDGLAPLEGLRTKEGESLGAHASRETSMFGWIKCQLSTDEELMAKLQAGETEALTILFERYSSLVFKIACSILRDDAEAEDAVQQVFLDVFRSVAKFDPAKGTFKVWLLMYAYQRTLNRKRGLRAARFYEIEDLDEVLRDHSIAEKKRPFLFEAAEAAHLVRETLAKIQPRQREVIELVYYEGCTAEEIAARTGDSTNVVYHNLYRGMEKARSILRQVIGGKGKPTRGKVR